MAALNREINLLKYVPVYVMDHEMCALAVIHYEDALEYVPQHLKDLDLCITAVDNHYRAMKHVPEKLKEPVRTALISEVIAQEKSKFVRY